MESAAHRMVATDQAAPAAALAAIEQPERPVVDGAVIATGDPGHPVQPIKFFDQLALAPDILKGLNARQLLKPSVFQRFAMPIILGTSHRRLSLFATAQRGVGKTAAFVIAMLATVDRKNLWPQALCVAPSRDVAQEIYYLTCLLGQFSPIKPVLVVPEEEILADSLRNQICIGTAGRIQDLVKRGQIDMRKIVMFVVDAADHMLDVAGVKDGTTRLVKCCPPGCQFLLFSATDRADVVKYAEDVLPKPHATLKFPQRGRVLHNIRQLQINCECEAAKSSLLSDLYPTLSRHHTIVFVRTRETAKSLAAQMTTAGHRVGLLHNGVDMQTAERDRAMQDFRARNIQVLITPSTLRGVLPASLVVNYDLPVTADGKVDPGTYLHRLERAGRGRDPGVAFNIVHDAKSRLDCRALEEVFGTAMNELSDQQLLQLKTPPPPSAPPSGVNIPSAVESLGSQRQPHARSRNLSVALPTPPLLLLLDLPAALLRIILSLVSEVGGICSYIALRYSCRRFRDLSFPVASGSSWFCRTAALGGCMSLLRWGRAQGAPWDVWTCAAAAFGGHLELLGWVRAEGCPWDAETCANAAQRGHLAVLQWARANGCPWDEKTIDQASRFPLVLPYAVPLMSGISRCGRMEILAWARLHGCPWGPTAAAAAALAGRLDVLQWLRANGCPWDRNTCTVACLYGRFEVLTWARARGCPWDETAAIAAKAGGQKEVEHCS